MLTGKVFLTSSGKVTWNFDVTVETELAIHLEHTKQWHPYARHRILTVAIPLSCIIRTFIKIRSEEESHDRPRRSLS